MEFRWPSTGTQKMPQVMAIHQKPCGHFQGALYAQDWLAFAMGWIWLAHNLYLSVFLNGIEEFPAYSLKAIMVDKFERRAMLIFLDTRDTLSSE